MKTHKALLPLLILAGTLTLSSCSFIEEIINCMTDEGDESISYNSDTQTGAGFYLASRSVDTYYSLGQRSYYATYTGNTLGQFKTLVIPVVIKGYESNATSTMKEKIRKAFFGTQEETGWNSVKTYFETSSRGQMQVNGEVTDWFELGLTPAQVYAKRTQSGDLGTYYVVEKAVAWAKQQGYRMSDYDVDGDGWIDSIWLVYSCPNSVRISGVDVDDNPFWAFTFWDYDQLDVAHSRSNPGINTYAWASYDFMDQGSIGIDIDAHTYIHETGHVLGLDDYYDYDGKHNPLGCVDMQDYNVGDHNAFSKMAWGWNKPYVVTDSCTITINSAATSGNCILVRDPAKPWKGNAFGEYLLLELITPEGVWEHDAKHTYTNGVKAYTTPGVRIMHVDARLLNATRSTDIDLVFAEKTTAGYEYVQAASNTPSSSYVETKTHQTTRRKVYGDLIRIINADGSYVTTYNNTSYSDDDSLFKTGDKFTMSDYSAFFYNQKLHDGSTIPYEISFTSVSKSSATIKFTYKG